MKKFYFVIITSMFLLLGCANMQTNTNQYKNIDKLMLSRNIPALIKQIETNKSKAYKEKDRVLYYLDIGLLHHYNGDYVQSNLKLEEAERLIEELYTKSVSKAALSLLLNDNALDYFGEDYEDVYTNVIKAINYLHMDKFDDAFVEIRRINIKLGMLEDKYKKYASGLNNSKDKKVDIKTGTNKFHNSALGRYLSMIIYEKEGKLDDATLDFNQMQEAFSSQSHIYNYSLPKGIISPEKQTELPKLHVIAMIGKSPYKKAREYHIATSRDQLTIAAVDKSVDIVQMFWPGIDPNYYFKFSLPYIVNPDTEINTVKVIIDGKSYELGKLEDIGNVAVETFKVKEPVIFLKSITRSVIKGIAAEAAKDKMKEKNPGIAGSLMSFATDVAVYASENADLRISRFFPNDILVADIPLTEGKHFIVLEYYDSNGNMLLRDDKGMIEISKDKLNLVESWNIR